MVRVITQEIDIEEYPIIARKHKTYYIKTYSPLTLNNSYIGLSIYSYPNFPDKLFAKVDLPAPSIHR